VAEEFRRLRENGALTTLKEEKKAVEVCASLHAEGQFIVPVMSGDAVSAYLSAVGDGHTFSELDLAALYQAATLCALVLLKEAAVRNTENRLKGDFLDDLLSGNYPSEEIVLRRARFLGYETIHRGVFMLFKANEFETLEKLSEPEIIQIKTRLISLIQGSLAQKKIHSICKLQSATAIVLLLEERFLEGEADVQLATELKKAIEKKMEKVTVSAGLGRPYRELGKLVKSHKRSCRQAVHPPAYPQVSVE
jgi:hypothetical protein